MLLRIAILLVSAIAAAAQSNPEVAKIYAADQADRANQFSMTPERMAAMTKADGPRRKRVRELLDAGALKTSEDYVRAAFIFQHGETPDDYLLAHVLGLVATKIDGSGAWIAAASLDRYLLQTGKPQILGLTLDDSVPFNRALIPDRLREALCAPTVAARSKFMAGPKDLEHLALADPCGDLRAFAGKFVLVRRDAAGEVETLQLTMSVDKEGRPADLTLTGPSIPPHADLQLNLGGSQIQIKVNHEVFDLKIDGDLVTGRYSNQTSSGPVVGFK
jgi:hypothetical protein